ncbi:hypothetical protein C8F04DRAFT_99893 [Mycena alexandri]|uniref:MYND-type domain-containing protein n=1 Tax=Mycena alexandri TaxID=1745969 RepID=A0AAD6SJ39_9AGAR|nr:hypothetical protein C8F04DRAFT_99893 [Mycena alexandri]
MLEQRFSEMKAYLTREIVSKACDNVVCGVILLRTKFQRCTGYLTSIYCSPSCQATDWREGGHRDSYQSLLRLLLGSSPPHDIYSLNLISRAEEPGGVSSRDNSVLRVVLVHANYLEMMRTILVQEVYHQRAFFSRPYCPTSSSTIAAHTSHVCYLRRRQCHGVHV